MMGHKEKHSGKDKSRAYEDGRSVSGNGRAEVQGLGKGLGKGLGSWVPHFSIDIRSFNKSQLVA